MKNLQLFTWSDFRRSYFDDGSLLMCYKAEVEGRKKFFSFTKKTQIPPCSENSEKHTTISESGGGTAFSSQSLILWISPRYIGRLNKQT